MLWDFSRFTIQLAILKDIIWSLKVKSKHWSDDSQRNTEENLENISKFEHLVVNAVPADDLAHRGARSSAGTAMTQCGCCFYTGPALQGLTDYTNQNVCQNHWRATRHINSLLPAAMPSPGAKFSPGHEPSQQVTWPGITSPPWPGGDQFSQIERGQPGINTMHRRQAAARQENCFDSLLILCISLQNKIWNLPDRSTILPKFMYDKEGKLAGPTQILPVRVRGPALKTPIANAFSCILIQISLKGCFVRVQMTRSHYWSR